MIWDIDHDSDITYNDLRIINSFNNPLLTAFYSNKLYWKGCFGSMTIIKHTFLSSIHKTFNINTLIPFILTRNDRSSFERILACLLQYNNRYSCLISCISNYYMAFRLDYHTYMNNINSFESIPIVKYWSGR